MNRCRVIVAAALEVATIGRGAWGVTIEEYPVPTRLATPYGITGAADGALWFTEAFGHKIGRITTAGAITEYTVPTTYALPGGIVAGPDGALWFTEVEGNRIGRITTAGAFTEFAIATATSEPGSITTGPDGALWFTEALGNKVGRITTSGAISEYSLPTAASLPEGITAGSDGALWFAEDRGAIGRITTAGAITEVAVSSGARQITAGPDGALWFTEDVGNAVGRVSTSFRVTEFSLPAAGSSPFAIAAGADGALWFTEEQGDRIGRITVAGKITEVAIPTAESHPAGIAAGPDGGIWFTELSGEKIGELLEPTLVPTLSGWGLLALALLLGCVGVAVWRGRLRRATRCKDAAVTATPPTTELSSRPYAFFFCGMDVVYIREERRQSTDVWRPFAISVNDCRAMGEPRIPVGYPPRVAIHAPLVFFWASATVWWSSLEELGSGGERTFGGDVLAVYRLRDNWVVITELGIVVLDPGFEREVRSFWLDEVVIDFKWSGHVLSLKDLQGRVLDFDLSSI